MAFGVHALEVIDVEVELRFFEGFWLVRAAEKLFVCKSSTGFFVSTKLAFTGFISRQGKGARSARDS